MDVDGEEEASSQGTLSGQPDSQGSFSSMQDLDGEGEAEGGPAPDEAGATNEGDGQGRGAEGVRKAAGLERAAPPRTSPSGELESSAREAGLPRGTFGWISQQIRQAPRARDALHDWKGQGAHVLRSQGAPWRVRLRHGSTPGGVCNVGGGSG